MKDKFGRTIEYLRISITDRCNLRCRYCMPEGGVSALRHEDILHYEEMERLVGIMAGLGVRHVRVTGGEPTARRGCLGLVRRLHAIPEIESVSMTSNGIALNGLLTEAKRAGLDALNLSLDTLDPAAYAALTRGGDVSAVLKTLDQAVDAGIMVKINAVPIRGCNENALEALALLAKHRPICVRFIELMPIGCGRKLQGIPQAEVAQILTEALGPLKYDPEFHGHGPARYCKPEGFTGSIGFIGAVSHEFCAHCNRVRLKADGMFKLCLNRSDGIDLRAMLRAGAEDAEIKDAIEAAIYAKPERHGFYEAVSGHEELRMNEIGG